MKEHLSEWTTFAIGGRARSIVLARSASELEDGAHCLILGRGSKVLVSDDGYDGKVVINRFDKITVHGDVIFAGSGALFPALGKTAADCGLSGLEWAIGIPGSVGGGVKMNAGAYGGCIANVLLYADIVRGGKLLRLGADELGFSYRSSEIGADDIVISAAFRLKRAPKRFICDRCAAYTAMRRKSQPRHHSAGSVFKNPPGVAIAKLIDGAGLKGYRIGGAMVSREHANIIVNLGGGTACDVIAVINRVKTELAALGVTPEEELIYIGDF